MIEKPPHTRWPEPGQLWFRSSWPSPSTRYVVTQVTGEQHGCDAKCTFVIESAPSVDEHGAYDGGGFYPQSFEHWHGQDWGQWLWKRPQLQCAECDKFHDANDYLCLRCRIAPACAKLREIMGTEEAYQAMLAEERDTKELQASWQEIRDSLGSDHSTNASHARVPPPHPVVDS